MFSGIKRETDLLVQFRQKAFRCPTVLQEEIFQARLSRLWRSTSLARKISATPRATATTCSWRMNASSLTAMCGSVESPPPMRTEKPSSFIPSRSRRVVAVNATSLISG